MSGCFGFVILGLGRGFIRLDLGFVRLGFVRRSFMLVGSFEDVEFDAAVLGAPDVGLVIVARLRVAVALAAQSSRVDAVIGQIGRDGGGAARGEVDIVLVRTGVVGVT